MVCPAWCGRLGAPAAFSGRAGGRSCLGASFLPFPSSCSLRCVQRSRLCGCVRGACDKTLQLSWRLWSVQASLRHFAPSEVRTQWECSYRSRSKRSLLCPHLPLLEFRIVDSVLFPNRVHYVCFKHVVFFIRRKEYALYNFVPEKWKFIKAKCHLQGQVTIFGKIHNTNFLTFSIRAVHTATIAPARRFCQRSAMGSRPHWFVHAASGQPLCLNCRVE